MTTPGPEAAGSPADGPEGAPARGALPRAVAAVIRRKDGRLLMIRRGARISSPGIWATVTGRLEPGEGPREAAEREAREEVGLAVRATHEIARGVTDNARWEITYVACVPQDEAAALLPLALHAEEVAEARWVLPEEALALAPTFAGTRAFLEGIARGVETAAPSPPR